MVPSPDFRDFKDLLPLVCLEVIFLLGPRKLEEDLHLFTCQGFESRADCRIAQGNMNWGTACRYWWWKLVLQAVGKVGLKVGSGIVCLSGQETEGGSGRVKWKQKIKVYCVNVGGEKELPAHWAPGWEESRQESMKQRPKCRGKQIQPNTEAVLRGRGKGMWM